MQGGNAKTHPMHPVRRRRERLLPSALCQEATGGGYPHDQREPRSDDVTRSEGTESPPPGQRRWHHPVPPASAATATPAEAARKHPHSTDRRRPHRRTTAALHRPGRHPRPDANAPSQQLPPEHRPGGSGGDARRAAGPHLLRTRGTPADGGAGVAPGAVQCGTAYIRWRQPSGGGVLVPLRSVLRGHVHGRSPGCHPEVRALRLDPGRVGVPVGSPGLTVGHWS